MATDVSIMVATYNPDTDKLLATLRSCVEQKGLDFEIVITDDGSRSFPKEEVDRFFESVGFTGFTYNLNAQNGGTVMNVYGALEFCKGEYIKMISPGDLLSNDDTLSKWLGFIRGNNAAWSFADVKFYNDSGVVIKPLRPMVVKPYKDNDRNTCRKNYVLHNDICIGAATLIRSDVLRTYMEVIKGKIRYGEDNIYRLMMADGVFGEYYEKVVVDYEYGEGISTSSNSGLTGKLKDDWNQATELMMISKETDDKFTSSLRMRLKKAGGTNNIFSDAFWSRKAFGIQQRLYKR